MMKNLRLLAAGLCLGAAVSVQAGDTGAAQEAIRDAKTAYTKADSIQGAWTSTSKLIKKAEAAAAKGDKATAMKLAGKAKKEAETAYAQAAYEREHWSPPPYAQ